MPVSQAPNERITLNGFLRRYSVKATGRRAADNPSMANRVRGSRHWRVTLRYNHRHMTVPFSQGPALTQQPSAADRLNCLAADARGYENARDFEEWCQEYEYAPDSRKAERTYYTIARQTEKLRGLLSPERV